VLHAAHAPAECARLHALGLGPWALVKTNTSSTLFVARLCLVHAYSLGPLSKTSTSLVHACGAATHVAAALHRGTCLLTCVVEPFLVYHILLWQPLQQLVAQACDLFCPGMCSRHSRDPAVHVQLTCPYRYAVVSCFANCQLVVEASSAAPTMPGVPQGTWRTTWCATG
jgi:hypothetical protein